MDNFRDPPGLVAARSCDHLHTWWIHSPAPLWWRSWCCLYNLYRTAGRLFNDARAGHNLALRRLSIFKTDALTRLTIATQGGGFMDKDRVKGTIDDAAEVASAH